MTCLVVQWLRICLAVQGTQVLSLARELRSHMPWGNWVCVPQLLSLQGRHQNNPRDTTKIPMCCNEDPKKPKKKVKKNKLFFFFFKERDPKELLASFASEDAVTRRPSPNQEVGPHQTRTLLAP